MNFNKSKFKNTIDKRNPLGFLDFLKTEKTYLDFIDKLYPSTGEGYTRKDNGGYSFFYHTAIHNGHEQIDTNDEYLGSICDDLREILDFHFDQVKDLFEIRKMEHLYDSKKIDGTYNNTIIAQLDSILNHSTFIKNNFEKEVVHKTIRKFRKAIYNSFSIHVSAPITQDQIDYRSQVSYLLGEIKYTDITKIYTIAELHLLIDSDRTNINAFNDVFSAADPKAIKEKIIFEKKRTLITALLYAIKDKFPKLNWPKLEESKAFLDYNLRAITASSIMTDHSRKKNGEEYIEAFEKFKQELD